MLHEFPASEDSENVLSLFYAEAQIYRVSSLFLFFLFIFQKFPFDLQLLSSLFQPYHGCDFVLHDKHQDFHVTYGQYIE
jgi:hypothetical protein